MSIIFDEIIWIYDMNLWIIDLSSSMSILFLDAKGTNIEVNILCYFYTSMRSRNTTLTKTIDTTNI